jgi:hypothetical protein
MGSERDCTGFRPLARGLSAAGETDADGISPPDALRGAHDPDNRERQRGRWLRFETGHLSCGDEMGAVWFTVGDGEPVGGPKAGRGKRPAGTGY